MLNNVGTSEDAYIQAYMARLPEVKRGEARVIKKGDGLWDIARKKLGKNSKRSDVQDYMMAIAKLNGLNTAKKMNNLQVNSTIYLPEDSSSVIHGTNKSNIFASGNVQPPAANTSQKTETNAPVSKPDKTTGPEKPEQNKPVDNSTKPKKTTAEISFQKQLDRLCNNYYARITKSKNYASSTQNDETDYFVRDDNGALFMSFKCDNTTGKIKSVSVIEDDPELKSGGYGGYDYVIDENNKITPSIRPAIIVGEITPEQRKKLDKRLRNLLNNGIKLE